MADGGQPRVADTAEVPLSTNPSIELIPLDGPLLHRLAADPAAWAPEAGVEVAGTADRVQSVATATIAHHRGSEPPLPWAGYLAVDARDRRLVGTCAFKGPPDHGGAVEIAYFTFPEYEGRGYARAMALALSDIAAEHDSVRTLRAHTLPEVNASGRILTRLGFVNLGAVIDPEDGTVWRWERPAHSPEMR